MRELNTNKWLWISLIGILLLLILGIYALWRFSSITGYFIISLFFFYLIEEIFEYMKKIGISKKITIILLLVLFLTTLFIFAKTIIPKIQKDGEDIIKRWASFEQVLKENLLVKKFDENGLSKYYTPYFNIEVSNELFKAIELDSLKKINEYISYLISIMFEIAIIVPIIVYILIKENQKIKNDFLKIIPNRYFEFGISLYSDVSKSIKDFVFAKIVQSIIITILSSILFFIFGIKYPIILGIVLGIFNIIPYFGPVIGFIIVSLTTYSISDINLTILAGLVVLIETIVDNIYLQPFLVAKFVNQHPLVVITITLIGAEIMGIIGMVVAIPLYSIIKIILIKAYHSLDVIFSRDDMYNKLICDIPMSNSYKIKS